MSFDTWIHILELVLVGGIFSVTFWVLKLSNSKRSASHSASPTKDSRESD